MDGVKSSKVSKRQQIVSVEPSGPTLQQVQARVDNALKNRILSEDEVRDLGADLKKLSADDQKAVLAKLTQDLQRAHQGGAPVRVQDETLTELKKLPGLSPKLLADIEAARDTTVDRSVTQGLERTATQVESKTASDTRNFITDSVKKSHEGKRPAKNELTPEFRIGTTVAKHVWRRTDEKLDEKLSEPMKAAKDAMAPHVETIVTKTLGELAKNPEAATSAKGIFDAFLNATGSAAMDPNAVEAVLQQVARLGPKAATAAGKLGAKLGVSVGADIAKGAAVAGGKAAAVAGGKTAAVAGAKTAAATGGKALPVIGNAIAIGSTLFAAANFVSQVFKRPVDGEKIAKEGIHLLTQGVGIAFPWVALGGDLANIGWGAKIAHTDAKKAAAGETVTASANLKDVLPFVSSGGDALHAALEGALATKDLDPSLKERLTAAQGKLAVLQGKVKQLEALPATSSGDLQELKKSETELLTSLGDLSSEGLKKAAADAVKEGKPEDAAQLEQAAHAAGRFVTVMHKNRVHEKNAAMSDMKPDEAELKRKENAGELMGVLADLTTVAGNYVDKRRHRDPAATADA